MDLLILLAALCQPPKIIPDIKLTKYGKSIVEKETKYCEEIGLCLLSIEFLDRSKYLATCGSPKR